MPYHTLADITVPFTTQWGSFSGSGDRKMASSSEAYVMAFEDFPQFCLEVLGYDTVVNQAVLCPYWSNQSATSVSYEGIGGAEEDCKPYSHAMVTVTYTTFDPSETWLDETSYTTSMKFAGNMVTMPNLAYRFADGTPVEGGVGRVVPEIEFSVAFQKKTTIPQVLILSLVGKVNSTTFLGCAAGTVLFLGVDSQVETSIGGSSKYSITYAVAWRAVPWNYFLHPTAGTFQTINAYASSDPVYASGEMNALLA